MIVHGIQWHRIHQRGSEKLKTPCLINWLSNFFYLTKRHSGYDSHDPRKTTHTVFLLLFCVFLKQLTSPSVDKKCTYTTTPDRGRTTPQRRQERKDRDREGTTENKENIAAHNKDVDIFALPLPRTPVSCKKNARHNKNVLTTPNANSNGTKTSAVTPKGKKSRAFAQPSIKLKCQKKADFQSIIQVICLL